MTLKVGLSCNAVLNKSISLLLLKKVLPACETDLKFRTNVNGEDLEPQKEQRILAIIELHDIGRTELNNYSCT